MRKIFTVLFLILPFTLFAQYKSEYDVNEKTLRKSFAGSGIKTTVNISNDVMEATMLDGGYFTLGTINGLSTSKLDDNCQITFGHPYAKTSYPVIFIDGVPNKFEDLFLPEETAGPAVKGDTISFSGSNSNLNATFQIVLNESQGRVDFNVSCESRNNSENYYHIGVVIDPALGKWGDGYVQVDNTFQTISPSIVQSRSFDNTQLWERNTGAKGIGVKFNVPGDSPYEIYGLNWKFSQVYSPFILAQYEGEKIYDLTLMYVGNDSILANNEKLENSYSLELLQPDFSSKLFTRWDVPQFFDINNGIVFPNDFNAVAEIYNTTNNTVSVNSINSEAPSFLTVTPSTQNMTVEPNSYSYTSVRIDSKIVYEYKIADIALWFNDNSEKLDLINRSVYMPQTPVSDTGLTVTIDSVNTKDFPKIEIVFGATVTATGAILGNITEDNVFLYENQQRITDFNLDRANIKGADVADIVFVLDVTGSMGDEITDVKNNIQEFADSLSFKGVDYQLGLVTFLDEIENIYPFTKDVQYFQTLIGQQYAHGGGDGPENSLQALYTAAEFEFRTDSKKTFVWITDADFHSADWATSLTINDVLEKLLANEVTVHAIGSSNFKSSYYDPIIIPTGGNYYDIYGNFRDVLLDISRMKASGKYVISYSSTSANPSNTIQLKLRYAGLGGNKEYDYSTAPLSQPDKRLSFFPNPFNPTITFNINLQQYQSGTLNIYNILGQLVKEYHLTNTSSNTVAWNAVNNFGQLVSTGFYLVQLSLLDNNNRRYTETAKILYLK